MARLSVTALAVNDGILRRAVLGDRIAVLRVGDGLIKHWREYQDIAAITEALTRRP